MFKRSITMLSLALGLASAPAFASPFGVEASCSVVNANRFQCKFPAFKADSTVILYASMQCGSTGSADFSLQEFQVLAVPPGSKSEVAYQIPLVQRPNLGGVVNAGSPTTIYVAGGVGPSALIDLTPAPNGKTQCTVSISGE